METKKELAISAQQSELAEKLNSNVLSVINRDGLMGFAKAFQIANATRELQSLLTTEYMKPIMALQNNRLGFKTDRDPQGYPEDVVKNCLIEAVLTGVQPHGNQFNIIAGNMYVTKEGFGYLLAKFPGLKYELIPALPRINAESTSAAVDITIKWKLAGESREEVIPIPVKMNKFMGTDAVLGKATRKARAWLYNTISGTEIADGDAVDVKSEVVDTKINSKDAKSEGAANATASLLNGQKG